MSRPRGRVALHSCQGFVMRRVSPADARALVDDPTSGFVLTDEGKVIKTSYQKAREESPTCLTVSDMKMIAGEYGDPMPTEKRRDGYIDPIESAFDKYHSWASINAQELAAVCGIYCPWPRDRQVVLYSNDKRSTADNDPVSDDVREYWKFRIASGGIKF